ncbi:response regulator [Clostridium butyricum]|uniref:response regulator n=1 Tax=Clostridium butyricum TaxID=1492 RepID=UPI002107CE35|nr:response regulator [Clostridium butyricum]MCQ2013439.1 response regulator [Clostridium butyricum]MCQ2027704.1 response regulator [Clostridium butyricum]MDU4853152.1 response regulator [Clostridioides difficile]
MYKVLIADDEPLMREALKIMISRIDGFEVLYTVGSGEEAVEICKNNKIDIVFMDILMPGMSGIEATKKIYINNIEITIYIVSSYNNFDFAIEALKSKVKEYISKPISFNGIKNVLNVYRLENNKKDINLKYGKDILFENLFELIKRQQFKNVYYELPKVMELFYSYEISNNNTFEEEILKVGQKLIDSNRIFEEQNIDINKMFPINDLLVNSKKYYEFWMFNIINYIYQENSIRKYSVLRSVFKYIDSHIEDEIGLNEIINNCSLSQGYLSRIFKRQFNISVMEYIHMRKIMKAKNYFCFSNMSITDVAFKLGYNESSYFSKVFKKYENKTVYQYRKTL